MGRPKPFSHLPIDCTSPSQGLELGAGDACSPRLLINIIARGSNFWTSIPRGSSLAKPKLGKNSGRNLNKFCKRLRNFSLFTAGFAKAASAGVAVAVNPKRAFRFR